MQRSHVAAAVIVAGLFGNSVALAQNIPAELTQARADRREAMMRGNAQVFDRLTTAGYIAVDQAGRVETKAQRMARFTPPPANAPQGPLAPPQRMNEHTAVYNNDTVVFFWQQKGGAGMQNFMETWVREGGQWKNAATHIAVSGANAAPAGGGRGRGGE